MTPGEIRACYRLYAAHRKSREICTFAGTIPVINKPGDPDDLAGLLRLHTGLEGLARDIGHGDPNRPAVAGHVGHFRAATEQLGSEGCEHLSRSGRALKAIGLAQL
jgi:hypothetical protein